MYFSGLNYFALGYCLNIVLNEQNIIISTYLYEILMTTQIMI